ncbi:hypothetical protein [Terasakiella brassicae]|nr:hypothetical protein [Terasakiella brassicae]
MKRIIKRATLMSSEFFIEQFEKIQGAKAKRMDWLELASCVEKMLQSPELLSVYPNREAFWNDVEQATGYSRNALQRQSTTKRLLENHEKAEKDFLQEMLGLKEWKPGIVAEIIGQFPKMELYFRIYKYDPMEAIKLLKRMQEEPVSVAKIRDILSRLLDKNPTFEPYTPTHTFQSRHNKSRANEERERTAALEQQQAIIYESENVSIYFDHFQFRYVSIDAVALQHGEEGQISNLDGFLILKGLTPKRDSTFQRLLATIDYRSSFFRHLWLYSMNTSPWPLDQINSAIDELGIQQIGIIEYNPKSGLEIMRKPESSEKPMRYNIVMNEIMRQGIKDYGLA